MNIKELEYILELCNELDGLENDFSDIAIHFSSEYDLDKIEEVAIFGIRKQFTSTIEKFRKFKKQVDRKYHLAWEEAYPEMDKIDLTEEE